MVIENKLKQAEISEKENNWNVENHTKFQINRKTTGNYNCKH